MSSTKPCDAALLSTSPAPKVPLSDFIQLYSSRDKLDDSLSLAENVSETPEILFAKGETPIIEQEDDDEKSQDSSDQGWSRYTLTEKEEENEKILEAKCEQFMSDYGPTRCGKKTFAEIVSDTSAMLLKDLASATVPLPARDRSTARPMSIQYIGQQQRTVTHGQAMTTAVIEGKFYNTAVLLALHAIDGETIALPTVEHRALLDDIEYMRERTYKHGHGDFKNLSQDLQTARNLIENSFTAGTQEGMGTLSINLEQAPELRADRPVNTPGTNRFLSTLGYNLGYQAWKWNKLLYQASTGDSIPHQIQARLMIPEFREEMDKYCSPEGYKWDPRHSVEPGQESVILSDHFFEKDPLVQDYKSDLMCQSDLSSMTPDIYEYLTHTKSMLAEARKLIKDNEIEEVTKASITRAMNALKSTTDPGPTVTESFRTLNPYQFALSQLAIYDEMALEGPDSIEPKLPHGALPGFYKDFPDYRPGLHSRQQ